MIGIATQFKDKSDGKRARVTAVLSKQYKVTMLEGVEEGNGHEYLHANVDPVHVPSTPPAASLAASPAPPAASAAGIVEDISALRR